MESLSLSGVVDEQIAAAKSATSGRAAHTVYGGHDHSLRQTVIALAAGQELAEHETAGEATLQVLRGHVRLIAGTESVDGSVGDYLVVPRTGTACRLSRTPRCCSPCCPIREKRPARLETASRRTHYGPTHSRSPCYAETVRLLRLPRSRRRPVDARQ